MSQPALVPIECQKCGAQFDGVVWTTINATQAPELRDRLLSGELMRFTCPSCGYSEHYFYDLLYHDMARKYLVWLAQSAEARAEFAKGYLSEEFEMFPDYQFRVVGTYNRLIEKVLILANGLDDQVVEIIKLHIVDAAQDKGQTVLIEDLYFKHFEDGETLVFVELLDKTQEERGYRLPFKIYSWGEDIVKKYQQDYGSEEPAWLEIDHNYVPDIMEKMAAEKPRSQPVDHGKDNKGRENGRKKRRK